MKDLNSVRAILEALIREVGIAVSSNVFFGGRDLLNKRDLESYFGRSEHIPYSAPFDIYLKNLKEELPNDYDEELFTKIYKSAFCAHRRSSFSLHYSISHQLSNQDSAQPLDIYVDVDSIVDALKEQFALDQQPTALFENMNKAYWYEERKSYSENNTTIKIVRQSRAECQDFLNALDVNVTPNYNFLLAIGATLAGFSISSIVYGVAIILALTASVAAPVAAVVGGLVAGTLGCFFFNSTRNRPVQEHSNNLYPLFKAESIDIQQVCEEYFQTNAQEQFLGMSM